tara:strand:+ start:1435 stop:3195 length:1761 start_codon:yes stop_codon:yes gene_type:complete
MILNVSSLLKSQNLISYRGLALGNIITDDLDLIYDPIDLQFVEGVRVYTNLSNATSGEEKLFGNVSDDEFLFGISAEGPFLNFMHHSLLVKFQKSETSNSVEIDSDLDGYNDFYGTGSLTNEYNAFYDLDEDGVFDLKQMISQNKSNITDNNNYSFILNNSFELWFFSMGLKFSVGDFKNNRNTSSVALGSMNSMLLGANVGDPTFEKSLSNFLWDINEENFRLAENGDFKSLDKFNFSRFDVSAMFEIGDFEIRGDANLSSSQNTFEIKDIYSGEYEYLENDSIDYEDYYSESDSYLSLTEEGGSTIGYGGSLRYTFDYQDERKNDGYWKIGFSMGLGSYDYDASILSKYLNNEFRSDGSFYDENIDFETNNKTVITDSGTKSSTSYAFKSSLNIPINDNAHFGIGAIVSQNETSRTTIYNEEIDNLLEKAFTDTAIDNYTITETYSLEADRYYDVLETTYIFPTGLEYRLGQQNQFSLRIGSIFQLFSQTIKDAKQIDDDPEPFTWIKEFSDGTQELNTVDDIFESTKEVNKATISSTIFTYGFGFNPMNNFQIDLLGIFNSDASILDTDFYKSLQISFTLKFE